MADDDILNLRQSIRALITHATQHNANVKEGTRALRSHSRGNATNAGPTWEEVLPLIERLL